MIKSRARQETPKSSSESMAETLGKNEVRTGTNTGRLLIPCREVEFESRLTSGLGLGEFVVDLVGDGSGLGL